MQISFDGHLLYVLFFFLVGGGGEGGEGRDTKK